MRIEDRHADWLSLVETSGPFLTVPVLKRALPTGLDARPPAADDLRVAYDEWRADRSLQHRWVRWVLDELLGLAGRIAEAPASDPTFRVPEHATTLRPTFVVRDPSRDGTPAVLLVHVLPEGQPLDRPIPGESWAATPIDRAAELARASEVPLALVTDGARWTLVWARPRETTGTCTWRAEIWLEERITLQAFVTLLGARRFFNLPLEEGLDALLTESASKQQEVADRLGAQVRRAVELLIATLDEQDRARHGALLSEVENAEVYRGAVTVMMRLVFLFVAEERRLLPIDDERYNETLAASTLRAQLQERSDREGEDPLERSTAAWHRILALFRAVHAGIEHDELRLPAYGGGLFDPDRFPFLEGRQPGTHWQECAGEPLPVDDRTMLHILDALQTLEQQGASVLLSYRALDVEQIGHVYEGLLDHTAVRLFDHALALDGKLEPELSLPLIESWAEEDDDTLAARLAKETGRSAKAILKNLDAAITDERRARLVAACDNDDDLVERVLRYHALLRDDLRGDPLVLVAGSLFVTQALDRRSSGTYYTPRQLAEEVVKHALDPIVFSPGPAEEPDPDLWILKPAGELLQLKVADIAMGSGAFLVAACRYLAARVLDAWQRDGDPDVPADPQERELLAHRLVAERCLYGVDRNPMAVEMAKLSLWLITLAKDKPFSFVDHALRAGDSLLGITDLRQLRVMHLDPDFPRQSSLDLGIDVIDAAVSEALELRGQLEAFVVRDPVDAVTKSEMLARADAAVEDAKLLGDLIVGAALAQRDEADPFVATNVVQNVRAMLTAADDFARAAARTALRGLADDWLVERRPALDEVKALEWADRDPFHWALEFPEVRARSGFDSIIGNPPFQMGSKISTALGNCYRSYLVVHLASGARGICDLVAYFFLRVPALLSPAGTSGLIATNTIAQGDTREVGLDQLVSAGWNVYRAVSSEPWPGGANLEKATVWTTRRKWHGIVSLDGHDVRGITSALTLLSRVVGPARRLGVSASRSFLGVKPYGQGFVVPIDEARALIDEDPANQEVIRPYLTGQDLNQRSDMSPSRCVIDFRDWGIERAQRYHAPFERVQRLVKSERATNNREARRLNWWLFGERAPGLSLALRSLNRCIALTRVSNVVQPAILPTNYVFSEQVVVFAYDEDGRFGVLSSGFHWWWAVTRASTMRTDIRYTPTDCFETFAQPALTPAVAAHAAQLSSHRSALMLDRKEGLTSTYNRVHDPGDHSDDIVRLREVHVALDHAVRDAYGWCDLELGHGFHDTRFGTRFTFAPASRQEVLDLLLELNHERYADEVRQGAHEKAKPKSRKAVRSQGMTLRFDV